jgi:death-on-curing protein
MTRREPQWLDRQMVEAIHDLQLEQHGGRRGVRDIGALESAIGRPRHRWHYETKTDLASCAAAYGLGLANNHPFVDGNKRTAFQAMFVFLAHNGIEVTAPEPDVVLIMVDLATDKVNEDRLAEWLRANTKKRAGGGKSSKAKKSRKRK